MPNRRAVQQLIQNLLKTKGDFRGFCDSDLLFSSGRLASVDALEVVVMLGQDYGIDFSDGFDRDALDSIDSIVNLIDSKWTPTQGAPQEVTHHSR